MISRNTEISTDLAAEAAPGWGPARVRASKKETFFSGDRYREHHDFKKIGTFLASNVFEPSPKASDARRLAQAYRQAWANGSHWGMNMILITIPKYNPKTPKGNTPPTVSVRERWVVLLDYQYSSRSTRTNIVTVGVCTISMKRIVVHESCIQSFQAGLVQSLLKGLERAAQLWTIPDLHGRPWLITRLRLRVRDQEFPYFLFQTKIPCPHWYIDTLTPEHHMPTSKVTPESAQVWA